MTIITALHEDGETYFGYGNGTEVGGTPIFNNYSPWIILENWALGITGQSILQTHISNNTEVFSKIEDDPRVFTEKMSKLFTENDCGTRSDDGFVDIYGIYCILLHRSGKIWDLSGCLSLTEIPEGRLWARGSGGDYAIGADYGYVLHNKKANAKDRVFVATSSAIVNDIYCIGEAVVNLF
jgi:ATP-dependent protease HslVU (ClpYQ) peptidase subunit